MTPFTEKVIRIIQSIPAGKVMTYGQIAGFVDHPRCARQVVRILHSMSQKYNLPWYRVVNAKGQISLKDDSFHEQKTFLENEGVKVDHNGEIDLSIYQWNPNEVW
ncbi:MAG TPA: MGMT family protein [Lachnospiraceae bacterium]|nr:MGMT family protein [Lachnospiraceae bacterium]HEX3076787.1 MGMT family protein [Lachnospiraceae bacterium]